MKKLFATPIEKLNIPELTKNISDYSLLIKQNPDSSNYFKKIEYYINLIIQQISNPITPEKLQKLENKSCIGIDEFLDYLNLDHKLQLVPYISTLEKLPEMIFNSITLTYKTERISLAGLTSRLSQLIKEEDKKKYPIKKLKVLQTYFHF